MRDARTIDMRLVASKNDCHDRAATGSVAIPFRRGTICVVGYELNSRFPGGGAFIIRNSWGTTWAKPNSRFQPGYGTLFFEYIKKYGLEAHA